MMTGQEFKAIRESLGVSQAKLAQMLGYSKRQIVNIEQKDSVRKSTAMLMRYIQRYGWNLE